MPFKIWMEACEIFYTGKDSPLFISLEVTILYFEYQSTLEMLARAAKYARYIIN